MKTVSACGGESGELQLQGSAALLSVTSNIDYFTTKVVSATFTEQLFSSHIPTDYMLD